MAKAFRTATFIEGREPLRRRMVCEIRYQDGQLYLDRCGRLLKQLLKTMPEWIVTPDPTPQGTSVYNLRAGTQLGFAMGSASLTLDKTSTDEVIDSDEVDDFVEQVGSTLGLVLDELEVATFTRLGYREHYYFSFDSKEESEKWLHDLGLVEVAPSLYQAFEGKPDALGVSLTMEGPECRYRVALNGIERSAQLPIGEATLNVRTSAVHKNQKRVLLERLKKQRQRQVNAAFAVVLDIDAFLLDPAEPDLSGFVQQHAAANLDRFRKALPKGKGK